MIKKSVQFLLGLNGASVIRGLRLGLPEFVNGTFSSLGAAHPLQDRARNQTERKLESIPQTTIGEILGARKTAIKLNVQRYEDGMMPVNDAIALLSILTVEKPKEVLEIGTFMGHTTKAMAENLPEATIHTLDLPPDFSIQQDPKDGPPKDDFHLITKRVVGREFKDLPLAQRIKQHFGDTAVMSFPQLSKPAFFFIDGSHTYEYCKLDSEKCFAACGGGGIFLWHDCDIAHPGVIQFVLEWRALGRNIVRIEGTSLAYWKSS